MSDPSPPAETKKKKSRSRFMPVEDQLLRLLVSQFGDNDWDLIEKQFPGRTKRQCRDRWFNHLAGSGNYQPWTIEEDNLIRSKVSQIGKKWSKIATFLPNRTRVQIKNRWETQLSKAKPDPLALALPESISGEEFWPS